MASKAHDDAWQAGDSYDKYMGRWSRQIAPLFLAWFDAPRQAEWLEVGCGTGALTASILARCQPQSILAVEPSAGFLERARTNVDDPRVEYRIADAQDLDIPGGSKDCAVSALVLNFVPDRRKALAEIKRVVRPGGSVGFYVWDYPGAGVQFMRAFWNAAVSFDPAASDLTEDRRFPFCTPAGLRALADEAGSESFEVTALEAPTVFRDFDDYWHPFTLGAGPAPSYCAGLPEDARDRLRERLSKTLARHPDGSIRLMTRAWAVKAR